VRELIDPPARTERLESLDVFRGLTIAAMILVNTPGTWNAVYPPLDHALWHGWTPTDLVFPFLLVAMGAAVPFALARRRGDPRRVRRHVVRRAALLFALGLVLNAIETPPPLVLETFRIPGVLQRIALVYLAVAVVTERLSPRAQIGVAIALLLGYWAAMMLIPVPSIGAGVLTPAGNLASFLDRAIFGRHILNAESDPEGLLSTLPAIATALGGVFAGRWLQQSDRAHRAAWLIAGGGLAVAVGLAWDASFPINKNLWTSSFALFSTGAAAICLALCYWIVDVNGWRVVARPLSAFGRNALAAYFASVGLDAILTRLHAIGSDASLKNAIYRAWFASWLRPCCGAEAASLAYAIAYVGVWAIVFVELYRRRIFIGI
jgi:predicted acyltransferase